MLLDIRSPLQASEQIGLRIDWGAPQRLEVIHQHALAEKELGQQLVCVVWEVRIQTFAI